MTRVRSILVAGSLLASLAGCRDTARDLAGGNQIDALQKAKTAAAQAGAQAQQRFKQGLKAGSSDADIEAATGEPAP
jgi:hypothetical protein